MFYNNIQVGLISENTTPPRGWYHWATIKTTERMQRYAQRLGSDGQLPSRVQIVRAVPGTSQKELLAICDDDWPVPPDEAWRMIVWYKHRFRHELSKSEAIQEIKARDPQHDGCVRSAPVHLTRRQSACIDELPKYNPAGWIRWEPIWGTIGQEEKEVSGWLVKAEKNKTLQTISGEHQTDENLGIDKLLPELINDHLDIMRELQYKRGGSVDWGNESVTRILVVREIILNEDAEETNLIGGMIGPIRYAGRVYIQPANWAENFYDGTLSVICPDCGGHLVCHEPSHDETGYRICVGKPVAYASTGMPVYELANGCGSEWLAKDVDDWIVLERQKVQIGEVIPGGYDDTSRLFKLTKPPDPL
jgi:hypothetical protein